MKKYLFFMLALVCSVSLFVACGDDNDESQPMNAALAGVFKGTMDIVLNDTPIASGLEQNITIEKEGDNRIDLELKNFTLNGMALGDIEIDDCTLTAKGDGYTFTGSQTLTLVVGKCDASVSGTIDSKSVDMIINVNVAALSQKVKVNFKGTKL